MPLPLHRTSSPRGSTISTSHGPRLERVRELIGKKRLHGLLVTNRVNVRYLSGFTGSSGCLVITRKKLFFITDFRYQEQAAQELGTGIFGQRRLCQPSPEWEIVIEKGSRIRTLHRLFKTFAITAVGFESSVSYEFFRNLSAFGLRLTACRNMVEAIRVEKDQEEIHRIREAVKRAESAFLDIKPYIKSGQTERSIALRLEERLKKRGCNHIPFDIIVASGVNAALPHARASDKKLSRGDLAVIDWGGEAEGYYADMTRTFLVRGESVSQQQAIYHHVLKANRRAVSCVRPGVPARAVDAAARSYITDAGYGAYFGHGTGHGVGLEVHESPRIAAGCRDILRDKMVFTIEPGIYIPGLGGVRIEDMVVVRPGGPEVLTGLPRRLEIL